MDGNYTLSDIAAATGGECGFGGNGAWVLILLFAMIFGGNGFGFGGNRVGEAYATQADIQRAVDLNSIQAGQADLAADIQRTNYEQIAATKDAAYNNLSETRDLQAVTNAGFANIQNALTAGFAQQAQCCCDVKSAIMENRYLDAQNTAAINANTTAAMQKVLDTIQADKIATLTAEVSDLKTQSMFCGIPKINPYGYGVYPYREGCGCAGNF